MRYVGLDVHKDFCQAAVLEEDGTLIKEARITTSREALEAFFWPLGRVKAAMEAVGFYEWIYDHLEKMGLEVILAHPYKVRAIAEAKVKTDKVDARTLAHLLRADLLPRSYVPPPEIRRLRSLVGERVHLTRAMTRMKSRIRFELYRRGIRPPMEALFGVHGRSWLASLGMEAVDRGLAVLEAIEAQRMEVDARLEELAWERRDVQTLTTIPGIGTFLACLLVASIGDIQRFRDAEALTSYAGLVPSVHQSGTTLYRGHITKEGPKLMRWGLVQGVWAHLRSDGDTALKRFHRRVAARKGKAKATVATARKLLKVVYWMLL
ncbi:MAG: IS110 family transposase, partial [Candidatus Geothermarchaeales archaeon]